MLDYPLDWWYIPILTVMLFWPFFLVFGGLVAGAAVTVYCLRRNANERPRD